eukprot:TRINITY_DN5633_c0_g1_i1.p1 TRINITY_DN5633_c0_g1~~TRINITY_DN5633_c0_g1_i1.p1  ORF type:complete len:816 (-),score=206.99 TRINITY_DN5633_c0_g1_i1:88-2535(-)
MKTSKEFDDFDDECSGNEVVGGKCDIYSGFNDRFQELLELRKNKNEIEDSKNIEQTKLSINGILFQLAQDFVFTAETYGRLIISECALDNNDRIIKCDSNMGGQLGGDKYVVKNIIFKFARDKAGVFSHQNQYDPTWAANKVAGHELKGCLNFFKQGEDGLCYPLMALIDYKGFRLIAMTKLPIGSGSMRYGCSDAGQRPWTVHKESEFHRLVTKACIKMKLRPHYCGERDEELFPDEELWCPMDLEGHEGKDGRKYLVDFSRTMPPTYYNANNLGPTALVSQHYFRMFRSEFLQEYTGPNLCSDSLSPFISRDRAKINDELKEATKYFLTEFIPVKIDEIANKYNEFLFQNLEGRKSFFFPLTKALHMHGINMRYLGIICTKSESKNPDLSDLALIEAIARVCKNRLRLIMRETLIKVKTTVEAPFRKIVANELNAILTGSRTASEKTKNYWEVIIPQELMLFRFTTDILPQDLRKKVSGIKVSRPGGTVISGQLYILLRIIEMTGLKLSEYRLKELRQSHSFGPEQPQVLSFIDILDVGVRVKDMNIMSQAKLLQNLHYLIFDGRQQSDSKDSLRRYNELYWQLQEQLFETPENPLLLIHSAHILDRIQRENYRIKFQRKTSTKFDSISDKQIKNLSERSNERNNSISGQFKIKNKSKEEKMLKEIMIEKEKEKERERELEKNSFSVTKNKDLMMASEYYEKAIIKNENNVGVILEYARFLEYWGEFDKAENYYLNALSINPNHKEALKYYGDFLINKRKMNTGEDFLERYEKIKKISRIIKSWQQKQKNFGGCSEGDRSNHHFSCKQKQEGI